ncbi:hypothetical protein [Mycetocola miduiensis]|uniref:Uncharacterized protein n=1 Tax=Mycetocola miduiensis TaxID=995034 RepID=A0A1I5BPQ8_9MICO|nr:hypothetical protein [Mycetocola miduiensis]SFN76431.1 hypothetical protein SAMN05216219_2010 [Mycetocola miduiensis]
MHKRLLGQGLEVSAIGLGAAPSNAVTPTAIAVTVLGASTNVTATVANRSAVTLTRTAPPNGGSAITGYRITPYIGTVAQTLVSGTPPGGRSRARDGSAHPPRRGRAPR